MAGRKSARVKKNFDYTSLLENDNSDESDDDFVGSSAPPLKKARSSQEENIKKSDNLLISEKPKNSTKKRKKLDDKLFERDIKMAMEISMQNIDTSLTENTPESKSNSCEVKPEINETPPHKELLFLSRHDIHSPPKSPPVLTLSVSKENEDQAKKQINKPPVMPILTPIMNKPSDDIEFLGLADEEEKKPNRNRRTSGRTAKKTYEPEDSNDDDDDSEFEEQESNSEENSDFEEKPKSKKKKQILPTKSKRENRKHPANTSLTQVHQKTEAKKSITQVHQKTESKKSVSSHLSSTAKQSSTDSIKLVHKTIPSTEHINFTSSVNETVSDPVTSVKIPSKMRTGTPIGKSVGNNTNLKSPPSIRRLGLSRNQRVKPLHPTLKVSH